MTVFFLRRESYSEWRNNTVENYFLKCIVQFTLEDI